MERHNEEILRVLNDPKYKEAMEKWATSLKNDIDRQILELFGGTMQQTGPKLITAKYKGKCSVCGGWIEPGTSIFWDKNDKTVMHEECPEKELFKDEKLELESEEDPF